MKKELILALLKTKGTQIIKDVTENEELRAIALETGKQVWKDLLEKITPSEGEKSEKKVDTHIPTKDLSRQELLKGYCDEYKKHIMKPSSEYDRLNDPETERLMRENIAQSALYCIFGADEYSQLTNRITQRDKA